MGKHRKKDKIRPDCQICPFCKTSSLSKRSMKMMINTCGHILCESCVNAMFYRGSGECPECKTVLRRANFRVQLFEDIRVEKDVQVRKTVLKTYNLREEDFETLEEYNDYLEEIEHIVHNLTNEVDVPKTKERMKNFELLHAQTIERNRLTMGRDEKEIHDILAAEQEQQEARRKELIKTENNQKSKMQERENFKCTLLDELQFSTKDASQVVNDFVEKTNQLREEERKVTAPQPVQVNWTNPSYRNARHKPYTKAPKVDDGPLYVYEKQTYDTLGPKAPTLDELANSAYTQNIKQTSPALLSGGYDINLGVQRALQDAFGGLYHSN